MGTVNVGPFSFSGLLLVWLCAVFAGVTTAAWLDRRAGTSTERVLWTAALGGLVAGRATFVLSYSETYRQQPISMIDIRDGGFSIWAAAFAAMLVVVWALWRKRASRKLLLLGLTAGLSVVGIGYASLQLFGEAKPLVDDIAMSTLDGRRVRISEFRGKPAVINLWASWCPPCRREMPALQDGQNANPDIHFVFANQGESADIITAYLAQEDLSLDNVMLDPHGALAQSIKSRGLPTTLFLDENGTLVDVRLGELSAATLEDRLSALRSGASTIRSSKE